MANKFSFKSTVRLNSGQELPLLGLGTYLNDDCKPACLAGLKQGYKHIDTARMYGNEVQVGEALRESGIPREEIYITTKINNNEHSYDVALASVDDSLKTLGLDYIDCMLIHSPLSNKPSRLETWRALVEAKKQGKVKAIGVSNYGVKHLEEIREANLELPSINQIELQPRCQQKEIVEWCKKYDIVIGAYAPIMRTKWNYPEITETAKKYNKNPAQLLVRWSLQRGYAPLPKSADPERVKTNADVFDFEISPEDMALIDGLDRGKEGEITWNPIDAE
ncbi:Aldo/keto reductase [Dendrothele bispora CBS 962.96]|uniref:Aldo/keto reductase n=1 Tax=Dendrothele bispora (strain CBS 962.96) TaxID=1314807 RepID=A0A4S8M2E1_DENBC|nr:Aldo/keto reductase [Dendrothele bispora CBS 962.96]